MKKMLITGAAHGLGACIAERAAKSGFEVGVFDTSKEAANTLCESLPNATPLAGDVRDPASIAAAI